MWRCKCLACKGPIVNIHWMSPCSGLIQFVGEGRGSGGARETDRRKNKWRWTESRWVVLNVCLHVGITWECKKMLMIGYHPEWIWVSQSEGKEKRRETLPEAPGTWTSEAQLEEDRWFGVGEVQGELISARGWNFWMEDGQVFGVQLLNGLDCHCNEIPSAATGKPRKNCKEGTWKCQSGRGSLPGGTTHCQTLLPWSRWIKALDLGMETESHIP